MDSASLSCARYDMYEASDRETELLRERVRNAVGLSFAARHRGVLLRAVRGRMQALDLVSVAAYSELLRREPEEGELQQLVQLLTVGETHFFRYGDHFRALIEELRRHGAPPDRIRCWSAGCSTGEEPYSIAIALMEALPDWRERDIRIFATDINEVFLQKAREGVYAPRALRSTPPRYLERYFDRSAEGYRVKESVQSLVRFSPLNLNGAWREGDLPERLAGLDAVFCRNVMIYFEPPTAEKLLHAFSRTLKPDGLLFLGHAETVPRGSGSWRRRRLENCFYYQSLDRDEPARAIPAPRRRPATPQPRQEEPTREERRSRARLLLEGGDLPAASPLLDRLIREDCDDFRSLTLMGFLEVRRGRSDQALRWCEEALRANDLFADAYFLKGVLLEAAGTPSQALREYRKAILLDRAMVMPRYHLARLYLKLGKGAQAAREIGNGIRMVGKGGEEGIVPYSGGLSPHLCLLQLKSALAQLPAAGAVKEGAWPGEKAAPTISQTS